MFHQVQPGNNRQQFADAVLDRVDQACHTSAGTGKLIHDIPTVDHDDLASNKRGFRRRKI
jgi:hypothetical protein